MKDLVKKTGPVVVSVTILYLVLTHFGIRQTSEAVRQSRPGFLLSGTALMMMAYLLRAARWRIWERSLTYWNSISLILIGFMGNNILPARFGEILRAHCTSPKTSDDRGRTSALASIAAERILDGLMLAVFGILGVALCPINYEVRVGLLLVSAIFVALASGLIFGIRSHERLRALIERANRSFPGHVPAYAREKATQFIDGLLPLRAPACMLRAIAFTGVVWAFEAASYYSFGVAIWPGMTAQIAVLFVAAVNFASLIPLTMGGIGSIEVTAPLVLVSSGVPAYPIALAMVLLQHGAQYLFTTVAGVIAYTTGGFHRIPLGRPKSAINQASDAEPVYRFAGDTRSFLDEISSSFESKPPLPHEVQLSIIIPAYNEQARLPRTVLETVRWCSRQELDFELIISDDGSKDETLNLGRLFEENDVRIRTLACPHMGKGAAVRMGILNSKGRDVLFMDADGATPLDEISKLLNALEQGHDVAIGSRVVQNLGETESKTSLHRRIIGRCFAFFVNLMAIDGIADTQCGFKMFRREAALAIFSRQKIRGFAFDVEILFLARRLSLSIAEVPVNWVAQPGSKINLATDSMKMLWDIGRIWWLHRKFENDLALSPSRQFSS